MRVPLKYDIIIVGAGPAGCACALSLKDSGLKVAMIDKQSFPRDKVCGDAIPGRAIKNLRKINPEFETAFRNFPQKLETKKTSIYYKGRELTFNWTGDAYTCARFEFDHFLFSLVKAHTNTDIFAPFIPHSIVVEDGYIALEIKKSLTLTAPGSDPETAVNRLLETKLLIGADGAQSAVAKKMINRQLDRNHHVGSVRTYFSGVAGMNGQTTEIYFDKRFLPSYLWVFPLPGDRANVGFGMLSSEIAKRKINIKQVFYEFIERTPALKQKFENANQIGELRGFGLPLGSDIGAISGSRFMLAGDAASLIDPISGDGIGNAMLSGRLAAEQAILCFEKNDFSAAYISNYYRSVAAAIGKELQTRYKTQRLLASMPWLLDIVFPAARNRLIKGWIQKML